MKQRIVTGAVAAVFFLLFLQMGGWAFSLLMIAMALVGYHEFLRIHRIPATDAVALIGFAAAAFLASPDDVRDALGGLPVGSVLWIAMFVLLAATVVTKNRTTLAVAAVVLLGALYIGLGFHYMTVTRTEHGLFWSYLVFICIWLTDIGAYFTGMVLGKRRLWPEISPKKTIEGAIGGTVFAVLAALVMAWIDPGRLSVPNAVLIGLVIAVAGQMGDLIQSAYKRVAGVKDSGTLLPGHGGVLDRTDSWLIVFPLVHVLQLI
jgi:phosphatidate cytidylyltransferase